MIRLIFIILCFALSGMAQTPAPEVRLTSGWAGFEDPDGHVLVGGSLRYYFAPRWSFEPEIMYFRGDGHHDITLVPNVAFDFKTSGRIIPYLLGGVGWIHSDFGRFSKSDDIFVDGGLGVKLFLTDHIYFAPEFRAGWEPHLRLSATFGFTF